MVNEQFTSENRKLAFFKEHKGKFHHKSELSRKLEETINTILSGRRLLLLVRPRQHFIDLDVEPQRLKADIKLLEDHLAERRLPIEQRELQTIAQNVIQNLIRTERMESERSFNHVTVSVFI